MVRRVYGAKNGETMVNGINIRVEANRHDRGKGIVKSWGKNGQRQEKVMFLSIMKAER